MGKDTINSQNPDEIAVLGDAASVVSVDAMGGDHGPSVVVEGVAQFAQQNADARFILNGQQEELQSLVDANAILRDRVSVCHAQSVVRMEDKPSLVMRQGRNSSMWAALEAVRRGEARVAVSCGNTGALMALAMLRLRRQIGVNRPAIAVLWPARSAQRFNIMLDVGADIRAEADDLMQYARMGAGYARYGLGLSMPRVGLLNVGTEENKGRAVLHEAQALMQMHAERDGYAFIGFVEGSDIPGDRADVIVTDGFTGNIALKTAEGTANLVRQFLRDSFNASLLARISGLFAMPSLKRLQRRIDPRHVNGGVFLGLNGTVVKSHGGADATGVAAAVKLAYQLGKSEFSAEVEARGVPRDIDDRARRTSQEK